MGDGVSVRLKTAQLNAAIREFAGRRAPEVVDRAVRRTALAVVRETVRGITTVAPTRVDTGRYRAGWRAAAGAAGLSTTGLSGGPSQPGDGRGTITGEGLKVRARLVNAVDYALFVETGTPTMAPGNHLTRALVLVRRRVPGDRSKGSVADELGRAWKGRR